MKTNKKNRIREATYQRSDVRKIISRLDKKIEELINFYISQIEKAYKIEN